MDKTLKISTIAIDKTQTLWYNNIMKNKTNNVYQIITSVKLSPNSKAYKKAIAKSKGMLTGSPDIYQTTGKFVAKKDAKNFQNKPNCS